MLLCGSEQGWSEKPQTSETHFYKWLCVPFAHKHLDSKDSITTSASAVADFVCRDSWTVPILQIAFGVRQHMDGWMDMCVHVCVRVHVCVCVLSVYDFMH